MTDWFDEPCKEPDGAAASAAAERQLALTKPPGSLGRVESLAVELAGWQRTDRPRADRVHIAVFAGDHGIAADGVSAYPQAVTGEMLRNFATGGAAIAVLARQLGATLEVIDLGTVNAPGHVDGVRHERIAASTSNIRHGAAMTAPQLRAALEAGRRSVHRAVGNAAHVFIGGDMGIGNTAVASALACALLGEEPHALTGAGTGLDREAIARKAALVAEALQANAGSPTPLETLRRLGGFEIAALTGAFIACAQQGVPALVDGFIATSAALAAVAIQPGARGWMMFAHRSRERGHGRLLDALGAEPLLDLHMRLGEASGAAVAVPLLRLACALHADMATFAEAGVSNA